MWRKMTLISRQSALIFRILVLCLLSFLSNSIFGQSSKCMESKPAKAEDVARNDKAIKTEPTNAESYILRGWKLFKLGRFDEAAKDADRAIQLDPNSAKAYRLSGYLFDHRSSYAWAVVQYSKAIKLDPDSAELFYLRGRLRSIRGESLASVEDFGKAISLDPEYVDAYWARGLELQGRKAKAKANLDFDIGLQLISQKLLETKASRCRSKLYLNRSFIYYAQDNLRQSLDDLNQAVDVDPTYYEAYHFRGLYFRNLGQYENAVADYSKAIELDPNFALSYEDRAKAYDRLKMKEKAAADRTTFETLSNPTSERTGKTKY